MLGSLRVFLIDKNTVVVDAFQTMERVFNNTWKLRLEFQPLTLLYTIFLQKEYPLVHLLLTNGTPVSHIVKNVASPLIAVN